jgi:hypothetical protein
VTHPRKHASDKDDLPPQLRRDQEEEERLADLEELADRLEGNPLGLMRLLHRQLHKLDPDL